jgi:hypothetical protein
MSIDTKHMIIAKANGNKNATKIKMNKDPKFAEIVDKVIT